VDGSCKILRAGTLLLALVVAGCPGHPRPTGPAGAQVPPAAAKPAAHVGRPYDVVPGESLVTILVYRAGALAKAGHNHLIASRDLAGTLYVPADVAGTSFEIRMPVDGLTIDEAVLRKQEGPDFAADVPDSAREGTRHNMLSEALLNAAQFPQIVVRSVRLETAAGEAVSAHAEVEVRGSPHAVLFPARYELRGDEIMASGELPLKQSELGLTPFSAMLGALQVQDEMRVRFRIVARAGGG
jgi:hypothetical protein